MYVRRVTDRDRYCDYWEKAIVRLLHPTQLLILEAISHLGQPISASVMVRISDGQIELANYDYHCKRLWDLDLLRPAGEVKRRGTFEKFYDLQLGDEPEVTDKPSPESEQLD